MKPDDQWKALLWGIYINQSMYCINVSRIVGIRTGSDAFDQARSTLVQGQVEGQPVLHAGSMLC